MIKSYRAVNYVEYSTTVSVEGREVPVCFRGGARFPERRNGILVTADENLQKAVENDVNYGKEFVLVSAVPERRERGTENNGQEERRREEPEIEKVPGISTKQMAIEYLSRHFGVELKVSAKVYEVRRAALQHKVEFTDWK